MSGQSRFPQSTSLSQPVRAGRGRLVTLAGLVVATLSVAGCGGSQTVQEMIGYDRSTPDEFAVMPRAPLAMPTSLDELPPPTPGAPRPQEAQPREQAEAILFGQGQKVTRAAAAPAAVGPGASAILAQAGQAQPDIRGAVDQETAQRAENDEGFVDRLMFWNSKPLPGTVVDPYKESARLNTNAETGKPLTTGNTPIIIRRRSAPLEGLVPNL
ncbi:MAG: DUF3035 domain-containing protein [Inquilinus limosus]|uniref:DUF3035 domain-containing protein n=1 Tax=Inquilinus limosus TaxID=171674 RepID=A0A952FL36_9PROT|nr:DUF3035 domain-containing protein [Inquilinus limosus]